MVEAMEAKRIGLAVAAKLLGYPDDVYPEILRETAEAVSEVEDLTLRSRLETAIRPLQSLPSGSCESSTSGPLIGRKKPGFISPRTSLETAANGGLH